jgi:YYY domain-containing protein
VLLCLLALITIGAAIAWWRRGELQGFLRVNWGLVLFSEALFLLAFLAFRELRLENPDLWHAFRGGEKPMDLAYLTAVARSTTLPAYDPWFAGGYINYYYLGQFLTANLIKLTSIPPEIAYNLAVPTFFALTVAGAFSIGYNLAAAARGYLRRVPGRGRVPVASLYAAGLLGAVLVAVAANLDGVGQLMQRLSEVSGWRLSTGLPPLDSVVNSAGGLWQVVVHGARIAPFDFWRSSRMMPPTISITEFPYFSFLFADLHAHMMAIAFQLLTIGACLSLVLKRRGERDPWRDAGLIALLGLVVGSLRWLNSWDYPPFLLLALAVVLISERHLEGGAWATARRFALKGALLAGLSFLLFQPFLANYRPPVSGLQASPETTPVHQYLAHFGVFAALIAAWLLVLLSRALRTTPGPLASMGAAGGPLAYAVLLCLPVMLLGATFVLLSRGQGLVAVLLPVFAMTVYLAAREARLRRPDGGLRLFLLSLVGLGLGLSMGVELVTLNGDIARMNTVFKFYLHTWVVFALVSAFAAWYLLFYFALPALRRASRPLPRLVSQAGLTAVVLLVLGALVYPLMATRARLDDRFVDLPRTLDGMAYMQTAVYKDPNGPIELSYDYEGIRWLRQNVEGTPAIVEGRTDIYRWGNRFATYTGLPAVLGWDWHQVQQRGDLAFMVGQRAKEIDDFYRDPDVGQAVRFLRRYDVRYVIVGRLERLYYPDGGLDKFDRGLSGVLNVAFANAELTIYEVRPEVLRPGLLASP